ncbi:TPA: GTPase [Providencia stuartii]
MSNKEYDSIPNEQKEYLGKVFDFENNTFNENIAENEAFGKKEKIKILIAGASGVGKSALINAVFGDDIVDSGVGKPVTQQLEKIIIPKKGLVLWDTKGIESKDYKKTIKQLKNDLKENFNNDEASSKFLSNLTSKILPNNSKIKDTLDLVWLCIDSNCSRFEGRDEELIKIINELNIPIVIVFTKSLGCDDNDFVNEVKSEVNKIIKNKVNFIPVNSIARNVMGTTIPAFGINDLIDSSKEFLSEIKANALNKAQEFDPKLKLAAMEEAASIKVNFAVKAAGTAGLSPIPGSDAPLIAAIQSKMIYDINAEFELTSEEAHAIPVITGLLGMTALAQVGKSIVSNTLKLIPVGGSIVGGVVSGVTAAAITKAVGHAYIQVLKTRFNEETMKVELPDSTNSILNLFKTYLQNETTQPINL